MEKNLREIRPYGDHWNDGKVQISFTLPVKAGDKAKEAARRYLEELGLDNPLVTWMEPMGEEFSFFVGYGCAKPMIDYTAIEVVKSDFPVLSRDDLATLAREKIGRPIVVIGGTAGSDAHTVGIDAILSIKGIGGEKGLEYYPCFKVINLRAQVSKEVFVAKVAELKADALLVSQLVTQQDQHLDELKELAKLLEKEEGVPPHLLKIAGGPRLDQRNAQKVGFDAGFGQGTKPSEVASYIVHKLIKRLSHEGESRVEGEDPGSAEKKGRSLFGWFGSGGEKV